MAGIALGILLKGDFNPAATSNNLKFVFLIRLAISVYGR